MSWCNPLVIQILKLISLLFHLLIEIKSHESKLSHSSQYTYELLSVWRVAFVVVPSTFLQTFYAIRTLSFSPHRSLPASFVLRAVLSPFSSLRRYLHTVQWTSYAANYVWCWYRLMRICCCRISYDFGSVSQYTHCFSLSYRCMLFFQCYQCYRRNKIYFVF